MCHPLLSGDKEFGEWVIGHYDIYHKHPECSLLPGWDEMEYYGAIVICSCVKNHQCLTCNKKPPENLIFILNIMELNLK